MSLLVSLLCPILPHCLVISVVQSGLRINHHMILSLPLVYFFLIISLMCEIYTIWLILLNTIHSSFIQVIANCKVSSFLIAHNVPLFINTTTYLSSLCHWTLSFFHILAVVLSVTMNRVSVYLSCWCFCFGYKYQEMVFLYQLDSLTFFLRFRYVVFLEAKSDNIPTNIE